MNVRVSSRLPCTEDALWQQISEPASLQFVSAPLLRFVPERPDLLAGPWQVGVPYPLKLYVLGFMPLGRHTIRLISIDRAANTIVSEESGRLARVWNHTIHFHEIGLQTVAYTDDIEIRAGWLTPAIWMFAHLFYRHRQRRWKVLLRRD